MRAVLVSVDYGDILNLTLPYNRHHFTDVCVVTVPGDESAAVAERNSCRVFTTTSFYDNGACFNKWKALEEGLDWRGRHNDADPWLCIMDADVLWPQDLRGWVPTKGFLHTPLRRMAPLQIPIPQEECWGQYPIHPNVHEWAGYSQIFHCADPRLGNPPWHEIDWRHAGGADSFFQQRWPREYKVRPPWQCLHLGPTGVNWAGRVNPYLDGAIPQESEKRYTALQGMVAQRRRGSDRYRAEKL